MGLSGLTGSHLRNDAQGLDIEGSVTQMSASEEESIEYLNYKKRLE